jgi:hypothetical protein
MLPRRIQILSPYSVRSTYLVRSLWATPSSTRTPAGTEFRQCDRGVSAHVRDSDGWSTVYHDTYRSYTVEGLTNYSPVSKLSKSSVFCVLRQSSVGLKSGILQPGSRANVNAILYCRLMSEGRGLAPAPGNTIPTPNSVWSVVVELSVHDASPRGRGERE